MGWFDEQIKMRKRYDDDVFSESFINIAESVTGKGFSSAMNSDSEIARNAISEILRYYRVKAHELPENVTDVNDQLELLLRPHGIMRRTVKLTAGWRRDAAGAMLAVRKSDKKVTALIPSELMGYSYIDPETGKHVFVTKSREDDFEEEALVFYKPFPLRKLSFRDIVRYIFESFSRSDILLLIIVSFIVTAIGMTIPAIINALFSDVISTGSIRLLGAAAIYYFCVIISSAMFKSLRSLFMGRIGSKLSLSVEAATMMRVLSLPPDFFKNYSAGELTSRTQYMNLLCSTLTQTVFETTITSAFSLLYIAEIFLFAPALVIPAISITLITLAFSLISTVAQMNISRKQMELSSKESGMTFALISGIQKIKLAGAEKRAFARWGKLYASASKLLFDPPVFLKANSAISLAITLVGTLVMYHCAITYSVKPADYYAFNAAYGMVSQAFTALSGIALAAARLKPILEMCRPILETKPEVSEGKHVLTKVSGNIELSGVTFRYGEHLPAVIDDLTLKIKSGQYIAIVGKTGCGKSTLIRLLLGFEKPQRGAVYFDGKDINSIDIRSLRKKIGIVIQNGKLFQGDIFSNIVISSPMLTIDDAWAAAELAGVADDIRAMPMGMFTVVSEGGGGISGGQKQRLMIARALAPKPKILILDEATSALDNITQKKVSDTLAGLRCTRIVIAHRLSTIKQCDRIIVLDGGKIIEDGSYDELLNKGGFFAELVERQRLDI